jgi:hypothetical protein
MKSCCKEANDTNDEDEFSSEPDGNDEKKNWLWKLKHRWQVKNILQVILILCTFALGGSACGYLGRKIMHYIGPEHKGLWVVVYIIMVTLLWPLCVLIISIPLGQYKFFRKYLRKLGNRMMGRKNANKK